MSSKPIVKRVPDPENPSQKVPGTIVKIEKSEEPHSYVHLEDGTLITLKQSVLEVVRITDRWDQNGQPVYSVTQNITLSINSPPNLQKGE